MTIQSLQLKHFRNFTHLNLDFNSGFNFFFGQNGQGKTNILEAIYYLADLKSFRSTDKNDLIQNEASYAQIKANIERDELKSSIEITITPQQKTVLVNGKKPKLKTDYSKLLPLLLFEPRHIYVFRDSPSERRKYLNRALYLQDPLTLETIRNFEHVISQKNKILKELNDKGSSLLLHLEAWNDRLVQLGAEIIQKRLAWFAEMTQYLSQEYQALSGTNETLRFEYISSLGLHNTLHAFSLQDIQTAFHDKLKQKQDEEIARRESCVGPHRDDFHTFLENRHIAHFGSQGENRSAVIALKLAQLKLYFAKYKKMPLFLLDDVASELDASRCSYLFQYLRDASVQAFLTTTENNRITQDFLGKSACYEIQNGEIAIPQNLSRVTA